MDLTRATDTIELLTLELEVKFVHNTIDSLFTWKTVYYYFKMTDPFKKEKFNRKLFISHIRYKTTICYLQNL